MWSSPTSLLSRALVLTAMVGLVAATAVVPDREDPRERSPFAAVSLASASAPEARADGRFSERRLERRRGQVGFSPGFSIHYQELSELRHDLAAMYDLGARRIRVDLSWALVERSKGRFDWSHSDRVFNEARDAGLRVLPILGYQPGWAGDSLNLEGFTAFTAAAVKRYGSQIRHWEIWNEPNLERFWFDRPDPAAYGRLVKATSAIIRRDDPGARIVIGALAPAVDASSGSQISPETFLRQAAPELSPGDFDAVSVHPYSYPALPTDNLDWNTFHRLPQMLELARRIGGDGVRLWLTEYGAPTGESDRAVPQRRQAKMLAQSVRSALRQPGIGPIYLYSYRDAANDPGDPEANFGLVSHSGTPKRAARRLSVMLNP